MAARLTRLTQVLLILLGVLSARLIQLQVIQGARYARLSDRNRIRKLVLPAPRGRILDRNGVLLADTRPSFTVSVVPTELTDSALPLLAHMLGVPESTLQAQLAPVAMFASPVNVKRDVTIEEVARIEELSFRLPGVDVRVDPVRRYPTANRYCHVLGHIGEVSEDELKHDTSLRRLDFVGRAGIEAQYESMLRGRDGSEYAEVDARGQEIGTLREKHPEPEMPGRNLVMTIDDRIQRLACQLLAPYDRAAVVGMETRTGAIVCLVSKPDFDPNIFMTPIDAETWDSLTSNPSKPFFNRALTSGYPPGSTMKPVVALGALRQGALYRDTRFQTCLGSYKYGNRTFKCNAAHGSLDLVGAIAQSCNTYFYQAGLRLGLDSLTAYAREVGLGRLTGIDMPGERPGNIPSREWLDSRYGKNKWGAGSVLNFAIGQGEVTTTPLQMAVLYGAIASGGRAVRPYLVARVDSAGLAIRTTVPDFRQLPMRRQDIEVVKLGLERVVEWGTGTGARVKEIDIAGKTGTAQNPPRLDHAWFVGYAPADKPEVVFAVLVENAGHGGTVSAPIAGQLIRAYFSPPESDSIPASQPADTSAAPQHE
ncbi:penicillin-binding protein 2 [candidate division WOR-3 bacterium]|uniref:Penicillin-binding protein 2 n=1 Tax=candidate division WOR-3 bacterium TaxID=2052148 RepID=A0A938BT32_UNCW3|nr:penicillin-binding protein 2 [candidate division WOR-3 bacterium]